MDMDVTSDHAVTVGVLAETDRDERRVALVPEGARRLIRSGLSVLVESGAGSPAWYPDDAYREAGARVGSRQEVLAGSQVVLAVTRPPDGDMRRLAAGQMIVGMLDPDGRPDLFSELAAAGVTTVSLERLPRTLSRAQSMDVLTSQAGIAGYKAVLIAAAAFGRYFPLLITAAGTSRPARVLVLGAGVAGLSAIGTARRLGAIVSGYDVRPETRGEIESLGARFLELRSVGPAGGSGGYARALTPDEQKAQQEELEALLPTFDVIVTTAAVPGRKPPVLVSAGAVERLRPGTVVVDMAAGPRGGNVDGSTPDATTVTAGGVTVIGAGSLASTVPTAASDALSQNLSGVLRLLLPDGRPAVDLDEEVTAAIVVTHGGRMVRDAGSPAGQPVPPPPPPPPPGTGADRHPADTEEPDEPVTAL